MSASPGVRHRTVPSESPPQDRLAGLSISATTLPLTAAYSNRPVRPTSDGPSCHDLSH